MGLVAGAYGELSSAFHVITGLVASQLADEQLKFFGINHGTCKSIFLQHARRSLVLALHRGWAKLMPGRCRDLVQHPKQPRPTAAEATDEGHAPSTTTPTPLATEGRPLEEAPRLGSSC